MNTLIYTTVLGLFCMVAEIFNLRKILIPAVLVGLAAIFMVNYSEWQQTGEVIIAGINMSHMIRIDHFSLAFNGLAIFISALIFVMSADYYKNEQNHISDYLAILIFILCGALILFSFWNLTLLFIGIEIVSISLYIMAGSKRFNVRSNEAGFKYFLMGSFASGILLFGITLIYGATNTFQLDKIGAYALSGNAVPIFYIGTLLMLIALFFKVAAVPFHFWSPDVYEGSPALVTALMATMVKIAFFGAFYRLMSIGLAGIHEYANVVIVIVAAVTVISGNLIALAQQNFKRLLAYSGIAHAGYMLLSILSQSSNSSSALFFYSCAYALATIGTFAIAIPVFHAQKNENIDAFNGLGKKNPLLAALLTMSMLSLAGIPPFAGFLAKYYIFSEAIKNGFFTLTLIAIITSIIGVGYYFKVILAMYTKDANDVTIKPSAVYWVVLLVCVALSLLLGVYPGVLTHLI